MSLSFLETTSLSSLLDTAVSLTAAFVLGTLIGAERQYRQRSAGLRTNVLVALGAAAFVDLAHRMVGPTEAVRVVSNVITGIGFLGAGVIMKEGLNIRGLNTAATLWCSAAVGACAGADMLAEAGLLTLAVLGGNTMLRPLVNRINRIPINERNVEAIYQVKAVVTRCAMPQLRELLVGRLEKAQYPVADVSAEECGPDLTEVTATLVATAVEPAELQAVIAGLQRQPGIIHVTWDGSVKD